MATLNEFCETSQALPLGSYAFKKLNIILFLRSGADKGVRRGEFALSYGVSPRTLNRWINRFNTWGIPGLFNSKRKRPGRKRKVSAKDFADVILPGLQRRPDTAGQGNSIKALFTCARDQGLFNASYSTFRRQLLVATAGKYRRRCIEPTFAELMYHTNTGRWPGRLKSFGWRRGKREQQAWERARESLQTASPGLSTCNEP